MKDYIPYELRSLANQIDPYLDLYWKENYQNLFSQIPAHQKELLNTQILQKKSIYWNRSDNTFRLNKESNFAEYIKTIHHSGIRNLAEKLFASCTHLEKYNDAHEIANFIEGLVSQVNKIDTEDNISLQKYKNEIRVQFIYYLAKIIKDKNNFVIPPNSRNLDTDTLKVFINEVYLKQQLLNFWFKTVQFRELINQKRPLFSQLIVEQKRLRQLEVVKTSKYFFCLSQPAQNKDINTYSIRRFLNEEKSLVSDIIYLNGVTLNLAKVDDSTYVQQFQDNIVKIVTIEKQIGHEAINFIEKIREHNATVLLPLLFKPLDSSGLNMEKVIEERLIDFEKDLILNILEPTANFLKFKISHQDEYHYIYTSLREIFSDILSYFQDFQSQPAVIFDYKAKVFFYRLVSWLNLLEKRYDEIFKKSDLEQWEKASTKMHESIDSLMNIIKQSLQAHKDTYLQIKETERDLENSDSFMSKLFKTKDKKQHLLEEQKYKLQQIKVNAFLNIIRVPKKYPQFTVYLEYESQISVSDKERHYAFSVGDNGISRLPVMVQLPEDRSKFNLHEVYNNLSFDINLANQKWV